jgi:pyrroline-5-carboxylate reductase
MSRAPAKIVFLGGGRITTALLAGFEKARADLPVVVHDRHLEKLRSLGEQFGVAVQPDLRRAVAIADILVIAVRPNAVDQLLRSICEINRPAIAVSLAAGVPLASLRRQMGPPVKWARAMPSPACRTCHGLTAVAFDRRLSASEKDSIREVFSAVGAIVEIPESKFDAFTATYSVSHGYHALSALASAAKKAGLDRKTSLLAAAHALCDGILSFREGRSSLEELLHEAATPGGTAAATMAAADKAGYRKAVELGVRAGVERARTVANKAGPRPRGG